MAATARPPPAAGGRGLWEIPASAGRTCACPRACSPTRELLEAIVRRPLARAAPERRHAARDRRARRSRCRTSTRATAFPVGGVAATELPDGVVSPGGVGYDINCGVRLLALPLDEDELGARREPLVHEISRAIPAGTGSTGRLALRGEALDACCATAPRALVEQRDRHRGRSRAHRVGRAASPAPTPPRSPSGRALRGAGQLGTLGSGQPLPRGAARRADLRRGGGRGVRPARGPGHRPDPLRLARARPPGLHRLRAS